MVNGPLAGYEVDAVKVTLKDGSYHDVDSDQLSFELAAKLGFKNSAKAAKAVIMEPIMKLEVITPEENMGDIVGDLNRRRGQVSDMGDRAGAKTVKATVPLSEMFGYVTTLRTLSSGRKNMSQKIRIKLKSYDHNLVDKSADKIVKTVKSTGAIVTGPIPLPTHKKLFTVLRSPHVNKKSREQFQLSSYKRLLDIYSSSSKTIDALMKLELPSGVEVEIKV